MADAGSLGRALFAHADSSGRPGVPAEEAAQAFVDRATAAWPDLPGDPVAFASFVAPRITGPDPLATLQALRPDDLWLAHRCAVGDPAALAAFKRSMAVELEAVLRDPLAAGVDAADLEQQVLARLFAPSGDRPPRIHEYGGKGPLGRWVYVVALRTRLNADRRRIDRLQPLEQRADAIVDEVDDPELGFLKRHYREAFREAFCGALAQLAPRDRTLLRMQLVHGHSATAIAELYRVHRATAKRWLADIRARLLQTTQSRMRSALAVDSDELESIMRLIQSRFEVSVRTHLVHDEDG